MKHTSAVQLVLNAGRHILSPLKTIGSIGILYIISVTSEITISEYLAIRIETCSEILALFGRPINFDPFSSGVLGDDTILDRYPSLYRIWSIISLPKQSRVKCFRNISCFGVDLYLYLERLNFNLKDTFLTVFVRRI